MRACAACPSSRSRSPPSLLGIGVYRDVGAGDALFPGGTAGWSLAVLTGIIVGHLVALGRDRWWGGTGSGAALTLAVLLLYGWVPAGLVSLAVVVLVGVARRHRWRQGVLHGAVDILGIGAAALVLAAFGERPHRRTALAATRTGASAPSPKSSWPPPPISLVTRLLLWYSCTPRAADCPPSPAPPCCGRASSPSRCSASPR